MDAADAMHPRHGILHCEELNPSLVILSLKLRSSPKVLQLRAVMEDWSLERIVQELN